MYGRKLKGNKMGDGTNTILISDVEAVIRNRLNRDVPRGEIWSVPYGAGYAQALYDVITDLQLDILDE